MATERSLLRSQTRSIQMFTFLVGFIGILLSIYAYYVETKAEREKGYKALCDFSATISCSKVFTSRYGRGFGLLEHFVGKHSSLNQPNSVFGMVFYLLIFLLASFPSITLTKIQIGMSMLANLGSVYLAYILIFVLNDFCVVCVSMYVVNGLILLCAFLKKRNYYAIQALKKSS